MARERSRNRSDHRPHERGRKTHKADVRQNRGEPRDPRPDSSERMVEAAEKGREKKTREEHPTRMKARGRNPDFRNR